MNEAVPPKPKDKTVSTPASGNIKKKTNLNARMYRISLGCVIAALFIQSSSLAYLSYNEGAALDQYVKEQAARVGEIEAARIQLQAVAGKAATLAKDGNSNALFVINQFKQDGIEIKLPQQ